MEEVSFLIFVFYNLGLPHYIEIRSLIEFENSSMSSQDISALHLLKTGSRQAFYIEHCMMMIIMRANNYLALIFAQHFPRALHTPSCLIFSRTWDQHNFFFHFHVTEVQKGQETCPHSHSLETVEHHSYPLCSAASLKDILKTKISTDGHSGGRWRMESIDKRKRKLDVSTSKITSICIHCVSIATS